MGPLLKDSGSFLGLIMMYTMLRTHKNSVILTKMVNDRAYKKWLNNRYDE